MQKITLIIFLNVLMFNLYADDANVIEDFQGGTVIPIENEHIRMAEEEVIYKDGSFTTTFIFENTSNEKQQILIGFPVKPKSKEGEAFSNESKTIEEMKKEIENEFNFRCWINGDLQKREVFKLSPNTDIYIKQNFYEFYFVTPITFAPQEKKKVVNMYDQAFTWLENSLCQIEYSLEYVLRTGALWKGSIGKAIIKIYVDDFYLFDTTVVAVFPSSSGKIKKVVRYYKNMKPIPNEVNIKEHYILWEFGNLEPDFDIEINFLFIPVANIHMGEIYLTAAKAIVQDKDNSTIDSLAKELTRDIKMTRQHSQEFIKNWAIGVLRDVEYNEDNHLLIQAIINFYYALYNYNFKDARWKIIFNRFKWYQPEKGELTIPDDEVLLIKYLKQLDKNTFDRDAFIKHLTRDDYKLLEDSLINRDGIKEDSSGLANELEDNGGTKQDQTKMILIAIGIFIAVIVGFNLLRKRRQ